MKQATSLFKTIANIKESNEKVYYTEGKSLCQPFNCILSKTIFKEVNCSENNVNSLSLKTLFSLFLKMLMTESGLKNGTVYLQTLRQVCQLLASKNDEKVAVHLITSGLNLFYEVEVENILDIESCLTVLFQMYSNLFSYQLTISNYLLSLKTIDSHLNQIKWKFKHKIVQGECFLTLCNTVAMFKKNCSESSMLSKIQDITESLKSFVNRTQDTYISSVCETMLSLITSSHKHANEMPPKVPEVCLESFLNMIWNVFHVLKVFKTRTPHLLLCLGEICIFLIESSRECNVKVFKEIVLLIVQVETEAVELIKDMWTSEVIDSRIESSSVAMCK